MKGKEEEEGKTERESKKEQGGNYHSLYSPPPAHRKSTELSAGSEEMGMHDGCWVLTFTEYSV